MSIFRRRDSEKPSEAARAREQAERELEKVRAKTPWYREWAGTFVEIQEVNHLGQKAARVLRGEK